MKNITQATYVIFDFLVATLKTVERKQMELILLMYSKYYHSQHIINVKITSEFFLILSPRNPSVYCTLIAQLSSE